MTQRLKIMALTLLLCVSTIAQAGKRNYVWSYDYGIGPKGATEAEMWWTAKTADSSRSDETSHQLRVEVEVPIQPAVVGIGGVDARIAATVGPRRAADDGDEAEDRTAPEPDDEAPQG